MKHFLLVFCIAMITLSCKNEPKVTEIPKDISRNEVKVEDYETAIIYEANIRQYSPEGTFESFTKDIPELKKLGVKIIWLMPIHPISVTNRKATGDLMVHDIEDEEERKKYLGSYYSVSDYRGINPEYGNLDDFKNLVKTAHENGMYVILDWVANHTGWDHAWVKEQSDYYYKDKDGNVSEPINYDTGESWGWQDVAHLNFENKALWDAMTADMIYWVEDLDVDGFRCDVAGEVPTPFWEYATEKINAVKPVFMLAESEKRELFYNAFDMGYAWEGHHIQNKIAQGEKTVKDWDAYMVKYFDEFQEDDILMNFIDNHDENSWNGTVEERMGPAADAMLAMVYTIPGMPLIYSGQEYGLNHRLKFFEKDLIPKTKGKEWDLLEKLAILKQNNPAVNGGKQAGDYERLATSADDQVLVFKRTKGDNTVIYIANLSDKEVRFTLDYEGNYGDFLKEETIVLEKGYEYTFQPWQYVILVK
ncbi:MAG TPA: alpha-amylase family glycosyl hydrolase [Flavobacteriaceae bacterium]|nr:alpha-amylase family glycosyl hydrolase [Flavobacteriaceae bacterium]